MDKQQKKDRLTGLLSLEVDASPSQADCLTAEELAALVDGGEGEKKSSLYSHLASCERCYGQWLLLKRQQISRESGRRNILLPKKIYGYIGTGLALAATLALYLNIVDMDETAILQMPEKAAEQKLETASSVDSLDYKAPVAVENERELHDSEAKPPPQPSKPMQEFEVRGKAGSTPAPAAGARPMFEERFNSIVPQSKRSVPAPKVQSKSANSSPFPAERSALTPDAAKEKSFIRERFFKQVEQGCRMADYNPDFWSLVVEKGEKLLNPAFSKTSSVQERMEKMVDMIREMDAGSFRQQCTRLLPLLAEEKKSM